MSVHQVAVAAWILVTCQMVLEVVAGGEYVPYISCQWITYYYPNTIFLMVIQFIVYSSITFVSYICIFVKIKLQQARRESLGKFFTAIFKITKSQRCKFF